MTTLIPRLILTAGETAGIGPDICLALARKSLDAALVVAADPEMLAERDRDLGFGIQLVELAPESVPSPHQVGTLQVVPFPLREAAVCGRLNPVNSECLLATLNFAIDACLAKQYDAMVTAPVQKSVLIESGVDFTGHTEYIANRTGTDTPVMLLASDTLRVALVTTHLALSDVPGAITPNRLSSVINVLHRDLMRLFGIDKPRIRVLGVNPHAGEQGHLGHDEQQVVEPVLASLRKKGFSLDGPVAADTAFNPDSLDQTDAILAMYHDQGLPALKAVGFGHTVNITLGLPIVRTSVDHGTALSLAGSGKADPGSLEAAVKVALQLISRLRSP